jgi:hypothetical protein
MKFLKAGALVSGLFWCMGLQADMVAVENTIESYDIDITIHSTGNGYLLARSCATCPSVRLGIDSNTSASVDGTPVNVDRKIAKLWAGGVVTYNIKTGRAARLKLKSPAPGL